MFQQEPVGYRVKWLLSLTSVLTQKSNQVVRIEVNGSVAKGRIVRGTMCISIMSVEYMDMHAQQAGFLLVDRRAYNYSECVFQVIRGIFLLGRQLSSYHVFKR